MASQAESSAEKLRAYLRELKPGARALLIAELERGLLHGAGPAGAELVLSELRRSLREGSTKSSRFGDPARLFFQPIEPFLVDDGPDHKHRGRIARSALEPLWIWIGNRVMPGEVNTYSEQVEEALGAGDSDAAELHARAFQDRAMVRITQMMQSADDKERRRLGVQLGTERAFEDVQALRGILASRDGLAMLGTQLTGHITALAGPVLESVKAQVDSLAGKSDLFLYSLVLVMSKLVSPWQLIRLAIRAANSDDAKRIAETPYAVTVQIVLEEVDRRVRELAADLKSGRGIAVAALLKEVHDALRGLRSEIDLPAESVWGKQLTTLRAEVSKILTGEIEMMPGRVRRLIRPRPAKEMSAGSRLDADEVSETEALIGFVAACRNYASELAVNEVTQRTFNELQQLLDTGTRALLDALRGASPAERTFRLSQVDAAVRFCAKVFGQEYASTLAKAAEVAAHDPGRKAAGRA
ncbi:MAG: hypothetical protein NTV56_04095 [Alphaproteobacteria bacterium]|nr:hypothetical protein [Alphaproteobacteria bacterium]